MASACSSASSSYWPWVATTIDVSGVTQAAIVVSQVFVGLAVRSERESVFRLGLLSNPRLIAAQCLGVGFIVAVSYVPVLQTAFHTAPLGWKDWALVFAFGLLLLAADEARKWWVRRAGGAPAREPEQTGR